MKCEGCQAEFSYARGLSLTLDYNKLTIQCPLCRFNMAIIYNCRRQIWETKKERDERRAGWKKLKHKVDSQLTEVAAS